MVKKAIIPLALAAAAAGCTTGDFEQASIVLDLRVLALAAAPPEVVLDLDRAHPLPDPAQLPDVHVTALVADPGGPARLAWRARACPPTTSFRCSQITSPTDPTGPILELGSGVLDNPSLSPGAAGLDVVMHPTVELLVAAQKVAPYAGLDGVVVQVELVVAPEGAPFDTDGVFAEKGILFSARVPADKQPNRNPTLTELKLGDAPWPAGACRAVAAGSAVDLAPIEAPTDRETYSVPTLSGGVATFEENLRYSWFATAGSWSFGQTGGPRDFFGNLPKLDTTWTAPATPGTVSFWIVQRDERGGATWQERCVTVN